ncbi:hypothetical protein M9H77_35673 [Catharanthus roseus]|uniref:Uncharacterized protein n=1 Tax=Catharanthus roseus TaxID=4058 RepID=A0ACB9ZQ05_CATRO|nr:hypothetical protein M9H77_35673 [Catharanthus roseus]
MISNEPFMLYSTVNNDDDEVDRSDGDDAVSKGESQTPLNPVNPVNPVTENIVPQWESSQWFSNARQISILSAGDFCGWKTLKMTIQGRAVNCKNPPRVEIGSLKTYENILSKITTYASFLITTKSILSFTGFVYAAFEQISTRLLITQT